MFKDLIFLRGERSGNAKTMQQTVLTTVTLEPESSSWVHSRVHRTGPWYTEAGERTAQYKSVA